MKIIDKRGRKDFYDYIVGVNGIDSDVIYDRRNAINIDNIVSKYGTQLSILELFRGSTYRLRIGNKGFDFNIQMLYNNKPYSHKELTKLILGKKHIGICNNDIKKLVGNPKFKLCDVNEVPLDGEFTTPIHLYQIHKDKIINDIGEVIIGNCILSTLIKPIDVYNEIYNFIISNKYNSSTPFMSDKDKINSHGFDYEKSFRNM